MSDLSTMSTDELCEYLAQRIFNDYPDFNFLALVSVPEGLVVEAARRLSRFAPIKIDPEDESTWPTGDDGVRVQFVGRIQYKMVECWDGFHWWHVALRDFAREMEGYTHWRRINNEPPEGE